MTIVDIPVALSPKYITQVTENNGRYYLVNGEQYQSITSLIDGTIRAYGIEKWRAGWIDTQLAKFNGRKLTKSLANEIVTAADKEAAESARIGTEVHSIIERLLKDEEVDFSTLDDQLIPAVQAWLKWRQEHIDWKLVGTEVGVYGSIGGLKYAGQVDALFQADTNRYVVVDWKTTSGLFESSFMQVAAYAQALEDMRQDEQDTGISQNRLIECDAMVVRLVNNYPEDENNKKLRDEPKVFNGKVQFADVDVTHWGNTFDHLCALSAGKSKYQSRKTI